MIGRSPDDSYALNLKSRILVQLNRYTEAETHVRQALELNPDEAEFWATLALVQYERKEFADALDSAMEGLRLDPSESLCLNIRTLCLTKLGRVAEAQASIDETLAEEPDDAFSHASAGWALLESGNHKQARVHFAEALRLQPGMESAASGMLQAIKSKSVLFRFFLRYYFWMGNLKGRAQWAVIFGLYFVSKWLGSLSGQSPLLRVVQFLLIVFVWLTWFIEPLFNVLMLFDRDGRHLLSDRQRNGYRYVAGLLLLGTALTVLGALYRHELANSFFVGVVCIALVLPLSAWLDADQEKSRKRMGLIFWVIAGTGATGLLVLLFNAWGLMILGIFALEIVLFMFLRNYLSIERNG